MEKDYFCFMKEKEEDGGGMGEGRDGVWAGGGGGERGREEGEEGGGRGGGGGGGGRV